MKEAAYCLSSGIFNIIKRPFYKSLFAWEEIQIGTHLRHNLALLITARTVIKLFSKDTVLVYREPLLISAIYQLLCNSTHVRVCHFVSRPKVQASVAFLCSRWFIPYSFYELCTGDGNSSHATCVWVVKSHGLTCFSKWFMTRIKMTWVMALGKLWWLPVMICKRLGLCSLLGFVPAF